MRPGAVENCAPGGQMVSPPPQRPVGGRLPHESLWPLRTTQELRQPDEMGLPRKYFVDSEGQRWGPE